jgi:uncharacterized protein with HEPN domain
VEISKEKTRQDLDLDCLSNLAMTRRVEMLGKAANRVSEGVRAQYPDLPWLRDCRGSILLPSNKACTGRQGFVPLN